MAAERCPYCDGAVQQTDKTCPQCRRGLTGRALLDNPPGAVREQTAIAQGAPPPKGAKYCQACGTVATPRRHTKGHFILEVITWLMFILPGVLYSLWRLSTRAWVCPACGSDQIIPVDSPKARAALGR